MRVILDICTNSRIAYGVQYCSTPEGFESIRSMHPEDEFLFKNDESEKAYNQFRQETWEDEYFLEAIHWNMFRNEVIQQEVEEQELEDELWYAQYEDLLWQRAHC
jgi:hypothetical protein